MTPVLAFCSAKSEAFLQQSLPLKEVALPQLQEDWWKHVSKTKVCNKVL